MDNLIDEFSLKFHLFETPPFVWKLVGVQLQICVGTDFNYPHHQILQGVGYLLAIKFDRRQYDGLMIHCNLILKFYDMYASYPNVAISQHISAHVGLFFHS